MATRIALLEPLNRYQRDKDFDEYMERLEQFLLGNDVPITGDNLTSAQKAKHWEIILSSIGPDTRRF